MVKWLPRVATLEQLWRFKNKNVPQGGRFSHFTILTESPTQSVPSRPLLQILVRCFVANSPHVLSQSPNLPHLLQAT